MENKNVDEFKSDEDKVDHGRKIVVTFLTVIISILFFSFISFVLWSYLHTTGLFPVKISYLQTLALFLLCRFMLKDSLVYPDKDSQPPIMVHCEHEEEKK